jgi:CBS-domain-containing membrane protein
MHMLATCKPLTELTAAEVMSRDVVVIPEHLPLQTAALLLAQEHVSGAPVVDARGRCVGVLSATDFVRWAREGARPCPAPAACVCADWQMVDGDALPPDAVATHMTRDPVTAPTTASVAVLARMMLDAHIHRVIIVDDYGRPVGVVSSTDVLAAVSRAGEGG